MISRLFLVLLICLPSSAFAMEVISPNESTNFCLDKQVAIDNEAIAARNSDDSRVIRLIALRIGLCDLLKKKIIELDFAIDVFDEMQSQSITDQVEDNIHDTDRLMDI